MCRSYQCVWSAQTESQLTGKRLENNVPKERFDVQRKEILHTTEQLASATGESLMCSLAKVMASVFADADMRMKSNVHCYRKNSRCVCNDALRRAKDLICTAQPYMNETYEQQDSMWPQRVTL